MRWSVCLPVLMNKHCLPWFIQWLSEKTSWNFFLCFKIDVIVSFSFSLFFKQQVHFWGDLFWGFMSFCSFLVVFPTYCNPNVQILSGCFRNSVLCFQVFLKLSKRWLYWRGGGLHTLELFLYWYQYQEMPLIPQKMLVSVLASTIVWHMWFNIH